MNDECVVIITAAFVLWFIFLAWLTAQSDDES